MRGFTLQNFFEFMAIQNVYIMIMKRNIFWIVCLLSLTMGAMAQSKVNEVGRFSVIPRVGVALANWSNNRIYYASGADAASLKSNYQAGFMGGVDVEYRATKEIGVSLGAYYAKQGFRFSSYEATIDAERRKYQGISDYHTNLHYLNVPLMVKGYVTRQSAFMVGVQAGFLLNNPKYEFTSIDIERDQYGGATYDNSQKVSDFWPAKKVDVSLPIGLSYEYMGVVLDARYNLGLTQVDDAPAHEGKSKNQVFTFSVGYRFSL